MLFNNVKTSTRFLIVSSVTVSVCGLTLSLWLWLKRRRKQQCLSEAGPLLQQKAKTVHIVSSAAEWDQHLPPLLEDASKTKVLGLDCEWVMHRPVALLQMATLSGYCVLVRLVNMAPAPLPLSLKSLLADRSVLKVGVAVNDDAKKLKRDYDLDVNGCVDLRHILHRVPGVYKCRRWGLQGLAKGILNINLSKDFRVRCGDWEADSLDAEQVEYAALDALVGVQIFVHLVLAKLTGSQPACHPHAASTVSAHRFLAMSRSLCQGIVDARYVRITDPNARPRSHPRSPHKKPDGAAYSVRKRPLWDNCELLAPDGQLLCTCDSRKAAWYLNKGLGVKVCDEPTMVVKLNFEPSGRPKSERNYYLQMKENMCVVCGKTQGYARKFIVPQEYRKYFPLLLKEHTSHDVLLMCPSCHRRSSDCDGSLRMRLAEECSAPLNCGVNSSVYLDFDLQQVKSAGKALKYNRAKIPEARIGDLEKILYDFYGVPEISSEVIEEAVNMDVKQTRQNYSSHAQRVVEHFADLPDGLLQFQARWRRHFVQTMQPQHLPAFWTVDYVPENWTLDTDIAFTAQRRDSSHIPAQLSRATGTDDEDEEEEEEEDYASEDEILDAVNDR